MKVEIEIDDATLANEISTALRERAIGLERNFPGTASMLRGVADQFIKKSQERLLTVPTVEYHL